MDQSLRITDNNGDDRTFPTLEDMKVGIPELVSSDGSYNPDVVNNAFLTWFQSGQSSCFFAENMAQEYGSEGWLLFCHLLPPEDGDLSPFLKKTVRTRHEAVGLTFPYATTVEDVSTLLVQIAQCPLWSVTRYGEDRDGMVKIAVRWSGVGEGHESWVLGFAPLESMPLTRRAPFTAIILRSKVDYDEESLPRKHDPPEVHLADLCKPAEIDRRRWTSTMENRAALVEPELDDCAKARVTFSLPQDRITDDLRKILNG
ncbi:hypothetical protein [Candidatus Poriferisocius sp.]|uniref:hypothetical protein n=1 Tax=Candidatus Poriferisocius sp. TaxID=3101276 RepID=UPI003B012F42